MDMPNPGGNDSLFQINPLTSCRDRPIQTQNPPFIRTSPIQTRTQSGAHRVLTPKAKARRFQCPYCEKNSSRKHGTERHIIQVHTKEKVVDIPDKIDENEDDDEEGEDNNDEVYEDIKRKTPTTFTDRNAPPTKQRQEYFDNWTK